MIFQIKKKIQNHCNLARTVRLSVQESTHEQHCLIRIASNLALQEAGEAAVGRNEAAPQSLPMHLPTKNKSLNRFLK